MIPNVEQTDSAETVRNKNILCKLVSFYASVALNLDKSLPFSKPTNQKDSSQSKISPPVS